MRRQTISAGLALLLLGCPGTPPPVAPTPKASKPPAPRASATPGAEPTGIPSGQPSTGLTPASTVPGTALPPGPLRPFDPAATLAAVQLTGKVKLISDHGSGIISNNGGAIVANNGGGYRLLAAPPESLLADAAVEVLDAQGRTLAGPDGKAIQAVTGKDGGFTLATSLPRESLRLRVRLWSGGTLEAILTADAPRTGALDLDTASSFGTTYVLDKYVKSQQAVFDRLPAAAAADLRSTIAAALGSAPPSYTPAAMVAATEQLRGATPAVAASLERIEAILLAGQKQLGEGRLATEVALSSPKALVLNPDGSLLIGEGLVGRIRELGADGRVRTYVADRVFGAQAVKAELGVLENLARAADGGLLIAEPYLDRVRKLAPDGTLSVVADGLRKPTAVCAAPDGSIYVGESPDHPAIDGTTGKLFQIAPGGAKTEIPLDDPRWAGVQISGLALAPDGTLYVTGYGVTFVAKRAPDGTWTFGAAKFHEGIKALLLRPDGQLLVAEKFGRRVLRYDLAAEPVVVAGKGIRGDDGDGGPAPQARFYAIGAIALGRDGTLYVADESAGTIRAVAPDGIIRTLAGGTGAAATGDALDVPVNAPAGATFDPQGRIVVGESGGQTVKRLENGRWTVLAGGGDEYVRPTATEVRLGTPSGLAYVGGDLLIADTANGFIRRMTPAGALSLLIGNLDVRGSLPPIPGPTFAAADAHLARPTGVVPGADGDVFVCDSINGVVLKLRADGQAEVIAGLPGEAGKARLGTPVDGAVAKESRLSRPFSLARDAAGNLYVADVGNLQVYRIDPAGKLHVLAGLAPTDPGLLAAVADPTIKAGANPKTSFLAAPIGLALAPDGSLFVSLAGTRSLKLAGNLMPIPENPLMAQLAVPPAIVRLSPDRAKLDPIVGPGGRALPDPDAEDGLVLPVGIALGPAGQLIICDFGANQIRSVPGVLK